MLFEIASFSGLTLVVPIFHNKKPIPLEMKPRNNSATILKFVNDVEKSIKKK